MVLLQNSQRMVSVSVLIHPLSAHSGGAMALGLANQVCDLKVCKRRIRSLLSQGRKRFSPADGAGETAGAAWSAAWGGPLGAGSRYESLSSAFFMRSNLSDILIEGTGGLVPVPQGNGAHKGPAMQNLLLS